MCRSLANTRERTRWSGLCAPKSRSQSDLKVKPWLSHVPVGTGPPGRTIRCIVCCMLEAACCTLHPAGTGPHHHAEWLPARCSARLAMQVRAVGARGESPLSGQSAQGVRVVAERDARWMGQHGAPTGRLPQAPCARARAQVVRARWRQTGAVPGVQRHVGAVARVLFLQRLGGAMAAACSLQCGVLRCDT